MKIAIPSDNLGKIASHTGRAEGFRVYEISGNNAVFIKYRDNSFTGHAQGKCADDNTPQQNHAHHSHDSLLDAIEDCQLMIAKGMGPRLVQDLNSRGIQVYFCVSADADEAAQAYADNTLVEAAGSCCNHKH